MPDTDLSDYYAINCSSCGEILAYAKTGITNVDTIFCEDCAIAEKLSGSEDDEEDNEESNEEGDEENADN